MKCKETCCINCARNDGAGNCVRDGIITPLVCCENNKCRMYEEGECDYFVGKEAK